MKFLRRLYKHGQTRKERKYKPRTSPKIKTVSSSPVSPKPDSSPSPSAAS